MSARQSIARRDTTTKLNVENIPRWTGRKMSNDDCAGGKKCQHFYTKLKWPFDFKTTDFTVDFFRFFSFVVCGL